MPRGRGGKPYPVNLIQGIRLENKTAHNTSTGRSLHHNLNVTVEDVELGLDGGGIALLRESKDSTIRAGGDMACSGGPLTGINGLGEVEVQGGLGAARIRGAGLVERIAIGVSLSSNLTNSQSRGEELERGVHGCGFNESAEDRGAEAEAQGRRRL